MPEPSSDQPATLEWGEREKQGYEDLLWGFFNDEMWEKYQDTGGAFAVLHKQVVAEGLDEETVLRELKRKGIHEADVSIIDVPSLDSLLR